MSSAWPASALSTTGTWRSGRARSPDRIIPLQLPWLADVEVATAEVRSNAARGFKAVSFPEFPAQLRLPSIFSGAWDPFFAACEETGTVVCLHTGASSWAPLPSPDPPFELLPTVFPVNALLAAGEWLWSGVPLRFPRLAVAMSEGGIGWVPMLMDRADYVLAHSASGSESHAWPSDLLPSEVLRRNFWYCSIDDPSAVAQRHVIGVDHIMVESDYPHADSSWPDTQRVLAETWARCPTTSCTPSRAATPPGFSATRCRRSTTGANRHRERDGRGRPAAAPRRSGDRRRRPRRRARTGLGGAARPRPAPDQRGRGGLRARRGR